MQKTKIQRALISVSDKELIREFAQDLNSMGVEIYGTRGTLAFLSKLGIKAFSIEDYTSFPEILGGRVKTLHPKIFGGILSVRDNKEHSKQIEEHGIINFDLVCVDLYPVESAISKSSDLDTVIENIDIGGISLIRASAKAFKDVSVIVDPKDIAEFSKELKQNQASISYETRKRLAAKAFKRSSAYDSLISSYLDANSLSLKYGENPQQKATYNSFGSWIAQLIKGELSYNNILDMDGACELCFGLKNMGYSYSAVIVKHGSPCGVAVSETSLDDAFNKAWDCDPIASYGGVLALSEGPDQKLLSSMKGRFVELMVSDSFTESFIESCSQRKKLKIVRIDSEKLLEDRKLIRSACSGVLEQDRDIWWKDASKDSKLDFETVSKRKADKEEVDALKLAWAVCALTKSNAIVIASSKRIMGIGGPCVSRIDATNMAIEKTKAKKLEGKLVMASDGFLPFADNISSVLESGLPISAVIEPGGSIRDDEVIKACNDADLALIFTRKRHFKH